MVEVIDKQKVFLKYSDKNEVWISIKESIQSKCLIY
jgi:hypothetical protein